MAQYDNTKIEILHGPSKWDLALALFDDNEHVGPRTVEFRTANGSYMANIHTCGDAVAPLRETWHIEGFAWPAGAGSTCQFRARFSTQTRKGELQFAV